MEPGNKAAFLYGKQQMQGIIVAIAAEILNSIADDVATRDLYEQTLFSPIVTPGRTRV